MFISKLVCDKCGTEAGTSDKFCRECGEKGRSKFFDDPQVSIVRPSLQEMVDKLKKPAAEQYTCKTCGQSFNKYSAHNCPGLFGPGTPIDIRWGVNHRI